MGIHTALDTNRAHGARLADAELEQIDLVILDIKLRIRSSIVILRVWKILRPWILHVDWQGVEERSGYGSRACPRTHGR